MDLVEALKRHSTAVFYKENITNQAGNIQQGGTFKRTVFMNLNYRQ